MVPITLIANYNLIIRLITFTVKIGRISACTDNETTQDILLKNIEIRPALYVINHTVSQNRKLTSAPDTCR